MEGRCGTESMIALLCVILCASASQAQWIRDGVPVVSEGSGRYYPRAVAAPGGGAYVTWSDYRNGYDAGHVQWIDQDDFPV